MLVEQIMSVAGSVRLLENIHLICIEVVCRETGRLCADGLFRGNSCRIAARRLRASLDANGTLYYDSTGPEESQVSLTDRIAHLTLDLLRNPSPSNTVSKLCNN